MKRFYERFLKSRLVWGGKAVDFRVDTVRLPNGKPATREYLDHRGAVAVVPFIGSDVVLVRQHRHPVGRTTLEIPAGKLDEGEKPLACIRRELREETGFTSRRIRPLIDFWPTPAFSNELIHIYAADRLVPGRMAPDADEFIDSVRLPFKKALGWVLSGKIRDSKTVIALLACAVLRKTRGAR